MIDKKKYPLSILKAWSELLQNLRIKADSNNVLIKIIKDDGESFKVIDREEVFYFECHNPNLTKDLKPIIDINFSPRNENKTDVHSVNVLMSAVIGSFDRWLLRVQEYDLIPLTREEQFIKQYEDEFLHDYEIVDADADTHPFEHQKQLYFYKLLSDIEEQLAKESPTDENIILIVKEAQDLKNNIQNFTKKVAFRKFAKIYARMKKHGIKFFLEVWDLAKKEGIKKLLNEGFETIGDFIK